MRPCRGRHPSCGLPPAAGPLYIRPALYASVGQGQAAPSLCGALASQSPQPRPASAQQALTAARPVALPAVLIRVVGDASKPRVFVGIVGVVPVSVRAAGVVLIVVPRPAPHHAASLRACPRVKGANARHATPDAFLCQPPSSRPTSATISATWRYWRRVISSRSWHSRR
jgi:hypothetical protein